MRLEERLRLYRKNVQLEPREAKIRETTKKCCELFIASEQEMVLPYRAFLWMQWGLIQKKWWMLQGLLLLFSGMILASSGEEGYVWRGMGVSASVFVIIMIPELWKNRSCRSMEIEQAAYYSLRQIYAARMVLFGLVDVLLLTAFCGIMTIGLRIEFTKLLVQFLVPMLVTACICFGTLCSRFIKEESTAILLCILWSAVWFLLIFHENIYAVLTLPLWLACIAGSFCFLCAAVCHTLRNCENCWEVKFDEIGVG